MKRSLSLLLALAVLITLCACDSAAESAETASGAEPSAVSEQTSVVEDTPKAVSAEKPELTVAAVPDPEPESDPAPFQEQPSASEEPTEGALLMGDIPLDPVSGDLDDYHFTILGAESFTTYEGEPGIRFYYDFTNNSDAPTCAWIETDISAYQDGEELEYGWVLDDVPENGNDLLDVMPGITIRCVEEYNLRSDTPLVEFHIQQLWGDDEIVMQFDLNNLQGRPADDWEIELIPEPEWDASIPQNGTDITLLDYSFVEDYAGEPMLRIYYNYTNNSQDTADSFFFVCSVLVMQDGIELTSDFNYDDVPEEENTMTDVEPGESIDVANCFKLRTESPVTVIVTEYITGDRMGAIVYPGAVG